MRFVLPIISAVLAFTRPTQDVEFGSGTIPSFDSSHMVPITLLYLGSS